MSARSLIVLCLVAPVIAFSPTGPAYGATLSITDLQDIDLGDIPPTTDRVRQRIRACVNMTPSGPYQIIALGAGPNGEFQITNEAGGHDAIGYQVYVSNRRRRLGQSLQPGAPSNPLLARRPRGDGGCRPPFVFISVLVNAADLRRAPGGAYWGRLQLTVAPE